MADTVEDRTRDCARIAEQNDAFRKEQIGGGQGKWVWTQAVDAEGMDGRSTFSTALIMAVHQIPRRSQIRAAF